MEFQPPPGYDIEKFKQACEDLPNKLPPRMWDFIQGGLGIALPGEPNPLENAPAWVRNLSKILNKYGFGLLQNVPGSEAFNEGYFYGTMQSLVLVSKADPTLGGTDSSLSQHLLPFFEPIPGSGLSQAQQLPAPEAVDFFAGFAEGCKVLQPSANLLEKAHPNFILHFILLAFRHEVQKRQSVGDLYEWLLTMLPRNMLGDLQSFQRMCGRIGLRLRPSGRPRKIK